MTARATWDEMVAADQRAGRSAWTAAFNAVRAAAYRARATHPDWDVRQVEFACGVRLRKFLAKHPELSAMRWVKFEEIPGKVAAFVVRNVKPRERKADVGEGKAARHARIVRTAEVLAGMDLVPPSFRAVARACDVDTKTVITAIRDHEARLAQAAATRSLDGDGRILATILRSAFREGAVTCLSADDLAEKIWLAGDPYDRLRLDGILGAAAESVDVAAFRHRGTVAVHPRDMTLSDADRDMLRPTHLVPPLSPLQSHLRDGATFSSPEALDVWALEQVGMGRSTIDAYERVAGMFGLARPDRLMVHVRRSIRESDDYDVGHGQLSGFVARGVMNGLTASEVSDLERERWPQFARLVGLAANVETNHCGDWALYLARHWAGRGPVAARRGAFLTHLLSYPAGIFLFRRHRDMEVAGTWRLVPGLCDRDNCAPDAFYDFEETMDLATYEASRAEEAHRAAAFRDMLSDPERIARERERLDTIAARKRMEDARLRAVRAAKGLGPYVPRPEPAPIPAPVPFAPPTSYAELDEETARLDDYARKLAVAPCQGVA